MDCSRRGFIQGLLMVPAAVAAAKMGAPEYMGEEIQEELKKDLLKTSIGFSNTEIFDNRPIWQSISRIQNYWIEEVAKKLGREPEWEIKNAVRRMVDEMDARLATAKIPEDQKIILEMPEIRNIRTDSHGIRQCDLHCGVEEKTGLFGVKEVRVGYLAPKNVGILNKFGRPING